MAVNVTNISLIGENPSYFTQPFQFDIMLECLQPLPDDLEWKLIYVGSAESEKHDQVLDSILVGPVGVGMCRFVLEANAPDSSKIPAKDATGVTCVLLTGSYRAKEFIRVGYFVNNEYDSVEMNMSPPATPVFERIVRSVLVDKPRVTRFPIEWNQHDEYAVAPPPIVMMETSSSSLDGIKEDMQLEDRRFETGSLTRDFVDILGSELSHMILRLLEVHELGMCRRVNRNWRKLIDQGVGWSAIDLSAIEWESEAHANALIHFVMNQCSPQLEELVLVECKFMTDQLLQMWLSKCAASLKVLNVMWCSQLTSRSIETILQLSSSIEKLNISFIGSPIGEEVVYKICEKYARTLIDISLNNATENTLRIIAHRVGATLRTASFPYSSITDENILEFVASCPSLETLGVELCGKISVDTVNKLRLRLKEVQASHTPEDYIIELIEEQDRTTTLIPRLQGWGDSLAGETASAFLHYFGSNLPLLRREDDTLKFQGLPEQADSMFSSAGFAVEFSEDEEDEEGEGDEMTACERCKESADEDELVWCDECERGFHFACVEPPLLEPPSSNWYCADCRNRTEDTPSRKKQRI